MAQLTSFIVLVTFAAVNLGLVRVKRRLGPDPEGFEVPIWVPALGFAACSLFAAFQIAAFLGGVR